MSGKPAARVADPQACPLPGHGSNPITTGSPDVQFNNLPAATVGSDTACGGKVSSGASTVIINGKLAATLDCLIDHGGVIIGGSGNIIIGDSFTPAPFIAPLPIPGQDGVEFRALAHGSGHAIAEQAYELTTAEGQSYCGSTDAQGMTQRVPTRQPDKARVRWIF
jgi:uncharacterized Zn-binding protein involved in type VI secretion